MPLCYVSLSEKTPALSDSDLIFIRQTVARGLYSKARKLDENHIVLRFQSSKSSVMLGDIELDIYAQIYIQRVFSRDKRANMIARSISQHFGCGCATWINLCMVGYSRATNEGDYYSDADNVIIRIIQKFKGVSTKQKATSDSKQT